MGNPNYSKVFYEVPNVYETPTPNKQEGKNVAVYQNEVSQYYAQLVGLLSCVQTNKEVNYSNTR